MKKFSTIVLLVILTLFFAGYSKDQAKSADGKNRGKRLAIDPIKDEVKFYGQY